MVWGVCLRHLGNYHDAEDAFQATFLVFLRKAASLSSRELLANWLYGVSYRTARKARSLAVKRRTNEIQLLGAPEPVTAAQILSDDLQPILDRELSALAEKYRAPIVLCDLEGKTRKEAAEQLGVPEGTVAGRLARARALLAKRLARHGIGVTSGMLAALVVEPARAAVVPTSALVSTIKAMTLLASCKATPAAGISPQVASLTKGVLKAMLFDKLRMLATMFVLAVLIGVSAGLVAFTHAGGEVGEPKNEREPAKQGKEVTVKMPSQRDSVLVFIGTEIKEGENVPPERLITVKVGGEPKKFRRLRTGDRVESGQLLAQLDDRLAQDDLTIKESKVRACKADVGVAESAVAEATSRHERGKQLFADKKMSEEELRERRFAAEKFRFDLAGRKEAVIQAEIELRQAKTLLELYQVRSLTAGIIMAIHKRPGEAVRTFETVVELQITERD